MNLKIRWHGRGGKLNLNNMPLYAFKCKDCKTEILKQLSFWFQNQHKMVYICECGGKLKRGWKRTVVKKKRRKNDGIGDREKR